MKPEQSAPLNYQDTKNADVMVAIPGSPPSGGTHIEIGWASAFGVRVVLLLEKEKKYSNVILGLGDVAKVDYVWFNRLEEIVESEEALRSLDDLV